MPKYTEVYNSCTVSHDYEKKLKALPKAELHVHLEGATSPETIFRMAHRNHISLPVSSLKEWIEHCRFKDFKHFLSIYLTATKCMLTENDFADMVVSFLKAQSQHNIKYSEVFFSTSVHLDKLKPAALLRALEAGIKRGEQEYPARMKLIPDISREEPHKQKRVLQFAVEAKERGIGIGLGLGGIEEGYPPELFAETFEKSRKAGLHIVAHAGETTGARTIAETMSKLHVERIGHGIRCLDDRTVIDTLHAEQIPLEVSPQSNYCIQVVDLAEPHPIRAMIDEGLNCVINTDDPAMFSTDLTNEYLTLAAQGFHYQELWALCRNAFACSFLEENEKQRYLLDLDRYKD